MYFSESEYELTISLTATLVDSTDLHHGWLDQWCYFKLYKEELSLSR
jgi:hypothetical protein